MKRTYGSRVKIVDGVEVVVLCVPTKRREEHADVDHGTRHTSDAMSVSEIA